MNDNIILDAYKKLDAIIYKYNELGKQLTNDDKIHAGIKAQDMEDTVLESNVVENEDNGIKEVDIKSLALSNAAAISELAKKVEEIENKLKDVTKVAKEL